MSRRREWCAITLILLLAAALRFWDLGRVPPGLAHDEVANWLIVRGILAGRHAIYFTAAYGHEPLYHYVQAGTVALFGDHLLGLRWPSAALGLLGIAVSYTLTRRLFGVRVALLAAAWLALSFWPLFYARVGLRAIMLPLAAALAATFLFRAVGLPSSRFARPGLADWLIGGFFLGLSLYTYMAARVLPFILVAFLLYLLLVHPPARRQWRRMLLMLALALLVAAPLVLWLVTHPGAEYRVAEVQEPLERLLAGDPSPVWQNLIANLKFFTLAGDPWPRQNLPGRPVFADPIGALLFTAGVLIALWRWRDPRCGFLLIWGVGALVPSMLTSVAPSSIRDILGLVVVFVFPALALVRALAWIGHRVGGSRLASPALGAASCVLLLVPGLYLTCRDYFVRWPLDEVVRFDYQADLTSVAHRLDELPAGTPVVVAGLSVESMDGPGLALAARRDIGDVRLCDTRETLVLPGARGAWLFVPAVVPFDADLEGRLLAWGASREDDPNGAFSGYRLPDDAALASALEHLEVAAALPDGAEVLLPVSFGGRLTLLGVEWLQRELVPGGSLTLLTVWRVEELPDAQLKVFVHLLGESEMPVAQHDGLGSPPHGWETGDLIVQKHVVPLPADLAGSYRLQVGLYDAESMERLPVLTADRLLLYSFPGTQ